MTDPEPPTPAPSTPGEMGAPLPGFATPPTPPAGAGADSPDVPPRTTTTTPTTSPSTGEGDDLDGLDAGWSGATTERVTLGAAKTVAPLLEELLAGAGEAANSRALDRGGHPQQWLTDARDLAVAGPLARILERFLPAKALLDPSAKDAVEAALILGRYLLKQLNLAAVWRRQKRAPAPADAQATPAAAEPSAYDPPDPFGGY